MPTPFQQFLKDHLGESFGNEMPPKTKYPIADYLLPWAGGTQVPISDEQARSPQYQAMLGGDNPLDPMSKMDAPVEAMTRGAQLLGKPAEAALRKIINTPSQTREELINVIGKTPDVLNKLEHINPQSLIDYLKQISNRVNKAPEVQEILNPLEKRIEDYKNVGGSLGLMNNKPDYSELTPFVNKVEEVTGIKTPLSTIDRVPTIKETPYTSKPSQSGITNFEQKSMSRYDTPSSTVERIHVSPSDNQGNTLGSFTFQIVTDKQTGKTLIQPQASYASESGKGIGTDVYKYMENKFGGKIIPDESRSPAALKMHLKKGYGREFGIPTSDQQPSEYESKYNFINDYLNKIKGIKE